MTKKIIYTIISIVMIIAVLTGCHQGKKTNTTLPSEENTTTTKASTTKHKHGAPCGNMGKWYSSKTELKNDYMRVSDSWLAKYDNGEIDWDTYVKNCPCGYECWSCGECGMWTGNYKY